MRFLSLVGWFVIGLIIGELIFRLRRRLRRRRARKRLQLTRARTEPLFQRSEIQFIPLALYPTFQTGNLGSLSVTPDLASYIDLSVDEEGEIDGDDGA